MNTENSIDPLEVRDAEKTDATATEGSPDLIEEKIRANLEPLNAQISTLTQYRSY